MSEQTPSKKPRTRSPAYPAIDLQEAVKKTAILWEKLTRHWGAADTIVTFWGYDEGSSAGYSALSALMKFGLIEDRGSGDKREVKLSDAGLKLVYNADASSDEFKAGLRRAALLPAMHSELWRRYEGTLPDDSIVERHLVLERGFNSAYVKCFIKQFRRTIAFSGLTPADILPDQPAASGKLHEMLPGPTEITPSPTARATDSSSSPPPQPPPPPSAASRADLIEIPVPLPSGTVAYYKVPFSMTEADFAFYRAIWEAYKPGLVRTSSPPL